MKKAALQTFAALIFFYFFGEVKNFIGSQLSRGFWQSYIFLVAVFCLPLFFIIYKINKNHSEFKKAFFIINLALLLFIVADIFILFSNKKRINQPIGKYETNDSPCDSCDKPDIYYFIFDAYTSSSVLKQDFNYSNDAIERSLKEKGFQINTNSRSNYNMTVFSLASVLNMDYLPEMDTSKTYYARGLLPQTKKVFNNQVIQLLEEENYQVYNYSIFDIKDHPPKIPVYDIWDTRNIYRQYNFLFKTHHEIGYHLPDRLRYFFREKESVIHERFRDKFDSSIMKEVLNTTSLITEKPKFVYAHFLKPHSPYTFDSTGQHVTPWIEGNVDWKEPYVQQLVYVNKLMERLVTAILANRKKDVVIIIQGDHGFRFIDDKEKQKEFSNFNAIYFSNRDYSLLNDSITNVNTFRIVFNKYLNKSYPLLENKTYYLQFNIR